MNPIHESLWHGFTMDDLDRLARIGALRTFGGRILDPTDRYETAWHAIAECLATTDEPPTGGQLVIIGARAVDRAAQDHRHTWGMGRTWASAEGDIAGYRRYWELDRRSAASPEDPIVDRTALRQIWPRLSVTHQQVLFALAIHDGDHKEAAAGLGKSLPTFRTHLKDARAAYRALWHEHETPSRMWGKSGQRGRRTAAQTLANRRQQRAPRRCLTLSRAPPRRPKGTTVTAPYRPVDTCDDCPDCRDESNWTQCCAACHCTADTTPCAVCNPTTES